MPLTDPFLVTGATGFIGSHILRRLVSLGGEVHILLRGSSDPFRIRAEAPRAIRHAADLEDEAAVRGAVAAARPRTIFHCASYGGHAGQDDALRAFRVNLAGTAHLVAACAEIPVHRFVHLGSSSEYGRRETPMTETDPLAPYDAYGASKAGATLWLAAAAASRGFPAATLRLFSPYGPMDDPGRLVPSVIRAFLRGEPPRLSSPGGVRDYVHVDDVVDACLSAASLPGAAGEVVNIGSGRQASVGEIAEILGRIVPGSPAPVWGAVSARPGSPCWTADVAKAKRLLGWEPRVALEEGLRRTVEWMRHEAV